ncbi:gliding motility-associated lipoprotein GldJ [Soonwooa buanensis]|uniref:Gliding motility-associated lipoprotein GldJ n=1 Tax=Soonwooa buanensis TaxID=619805 RepID=A0A1T5D305_9FLAO|nr:gliding motility lipoprotein GldJ [Soonwooa buanensis]SKB66065.1 gliding motility-associated lipoprotein GldJ [Soonwooa buanensis]
MKQIKLFSLAIGSALILASCGGGNTKSGGGTKRFTSKTGWKPNEKNGYFFSAKQQKQKGWPGMVYIDGGTFTMGLVQDDVMHDWNNTPRRMQVSSYFIGETEITNYEYREYVTWLKYVFPPSDPNFKNIYAGAMPDTLVWNNKLSRNSYSETYFRNPEFDYYPVVGVSWLQATKYCDWLTNRANEKALMQKGILPKDLYTNESNYQGESTFSMDKYKANDAELDAIVDKNKLQKQTGIKTSNTRILAANKGGTSGLVEKFRLPTEVEWEFAALGMQKNRKYNNYLGKEPEIDKLKGTKGRNRGMYMENFKMGKGDYSGVAGWKNDGSPTTSDVRKYQSNDLGVFGMYGNVAEWVADIYRPQIDEDFNDFNYYRGNVVLKSEKNADGTYKKVGNVEMKYDTMANGQLVYRGLPGEYEKQIVADDRNYRDGDYQSSLDMSGANADSTFNMYNSVRKGFVVDKRGNVILEKQKKQVTTAITNEVRVVKGGSWLDSSYWLDPGHRRFKDQGRTFSWIGFRVAQDAKDTGKRSKR